VGYHFFKKVIGVFEKKNCGNRSVAGEEASAQSGGLCGTPPENIITKSERLSTQGTENDQGVSVLGANHRNGP